jgi:hypothetical protein
MPRTKATTRTQTNTRLIQQNTNSSLFFNGSSYAITASNSTLSLANNFTVGGWIKISQFATASLRQKMIGTTQWNFGTVTSTQKLGFTTPGKKDYDSTGKTLFLGNWYFAVATFDTLNNITFYLNGQFDSLITGTLAANTAASPIYIGESFTPSDRHIGNLSQIKVWNSVLTLAQINNLYTNGIVPNGVIANFPLNEGAGSIAYDISGNGNNGTITSGTYSNDVPFKKRQLVNDNLVYNGDFEYVPPTNVVQTTSNNWIDGTSTGSTTNLLFGWNFYYGGTGSNLCLFDNSTSATGNYSIKISLVSTGIISYISNFRNNAINYIYLKPNTNYTLSYSLKTNYISGSGIYGAYAQIQEYNGAGTTVGTNPHGTFVTTTTNWTQYSFTWTTNSATSYIYLYLYVNNAGGGTLTMDTWWDNISLTQTTTPTRTLIV